MLFELCIYPPDTYNKVIEHCNSVLYNLGIHKILPSQTAMLTQRGVPHKLFLSAFKQN